MPDIEKVIKGLEQCLMRGDEHKCEECPYKPDANCFVNNKRDALELLKHQNGLCKALESVIVANDYLNKEVDRLNEQLEKQKPVKPRVSCVEQRCGNCNKIIEMDGWITCPWCGKPIAWEGR